MLIRGTWFIDDFGRKLMLRGVNLGGSNKVPKYPDGATHIAEGFYKHRTVSFVDRPFPLNQADEHYTRLREWGFNFIRFLITWEAIEHQDAGEYDQEYLDYIARILEKAGEYGFSVFIDPHQDVWSRFCGGDGAPGWTLEKVGFEIQNFAQTGAAVTHQTYGVKFPWLTWPTNMDKLACATMFTLFFAGNDFAPRTKIGGEPVQEYLQRHYINAIQQAAKYVAGLNHVVGFDTMNEPATGYIGVKDLNRIIAVLRRGAVPSPWQSIMLGSGFSQEVNSYDGFPVFCVVGKRWLNTEHVSAWKRGHGCVWRQNGVWDLDSNQSPRLLRPDYFSKANGCNINFHRDYYLPFALRYKEAIQQVYPEAITFLESFPGAISVDLGTGLFKGAAYAPHWYDISAMALKKFSPWVAYDTWHRRPVLLPPFIRRSFADQLHLFRRQASEQLGGLPVILGETGIPFDFENGEAYVTGDFSKQERALDRCLRAVEDNNMNAMLWNYTSDNDNTHGDQWNREDFSIYSKDQREDLSDINSGGRALKAVIRPYPEAVSGEPLKLTFNMQKHVFDFFFSHDPAVTAPTEIFIPRYHYPDDYKVFVSDGKWEKDTAHQKLRYWYSADKQLHKIRVVP